MRKRWVRPLKYEKDFTTNLLSSYVFFFNFNFNFFVNIYNELAEKLQLCKMYSKTNVDFSLTLLINIF